MPPDGYEPFLATILDAPHDDAPRLVYADWLEERGDPRAEYIRIQCEKVNADAVRRDRLEDRESQLFMAYSEKWRQEIPEWARKGCEFDRGFVNHVQIWGPWLRHYGQHLSQTAPVEKITLQTVEGAAEFADGPDVRHLSELVILDSQLEYDALKLLMRSPTVTRPLRSLQFMDAFKYCDTLAKEISLAPGLFTLRYLALVRCKIGHRGIHELMNSEHLKHLNGLDLSDNDLTDDCIYLLASSPSAQRLTRLCLNRNKLHTSAIRFLADSPHLTNLTHLELDDNSLNDRAIPMLVQHFPNLRQLRVARNPLTPSGYIALQEAYGARVHLGTTGEW